MTLDSIVLHVGGRGFSLFEIATLATGLVLVLLLLIAVLTWRAAKARRLDMDNSMRRTADLEYRLAELSGVLQGYATQNHGQQVHLQRSIDERLDQVSQRVGLGLTEQSQRTAQSLHALHERLAVIDAAQANLTQLSGEMLSLKDILNNKQTRGIFGQGRLEAIVRDGLHAKAYEFQATLSNGTRPDCVISLPDSELRLVIDAKFPLESYNGMRKAEDDHERKQLAAQLRNDVLKHVKDISEKYLISGETHDTAIMFVPSESIYAELNENFEDVIQKAHRQRVILASPNVLMLLVQTMQAIVKDAMMREQAHVIKGEVIKLLEDVVRLKERTSDLKKHFDQASADIAKIDVSAERIAKRGMRIESMKLEDPRALAESATTARPKLVGSG
jgi:DNA recombination protein RmuC